MSTALLVVLMSLSAIMLAGAVVVGVRHVWRLERESDEKVANLLSEAESGPEEESEAESGVAGEPAATDSGTFRREAAAREGRAGDRDGDEGRA